MIFHFKPFSYLNTDGFIVEWTEAGSLYPDRVFLRTLEQVSYLEQGLLNGFKGETLLTALWEL